MSEKTIFEKIIDRDIPADIIYEDDVIIAILDIEPITIGHTVVILKEKHHWIQDVPPELLGKVFTRVPSIIKSLKEAVGSDYVQLAVMGLHVPHFHIHLIPRQFGDNHNELYPQKDLDFDKQILLDKLSHHE